MNLLNLDLSQRDSFSKIVKTLVVQHHSDPKEMLLHAIESQADVAMNYWMTLVLVQEHFVSPQHVVAKDAAGEPVKALQAACLLQNIGVVAALLELKGYSGSVTDKEYQLTARMASKQEDQVVLGLLMKCAQEQDALEPFMRALQGSTLQ
jgi:hypothetical protein